MPFEKNVVKKFMVFPELLFVMMTWDRSKPWDRNEIYVSDTGRKGFNPAEKDFGTSVRCILSYLKFRSSQPFQT